MGGYALLFMIIGNRQRRRTTSLFRIESNDDLLLWRKHWLVCAPRETLISVQVSSNARDPEFTF
jgi:hypothetical protein